MQIEKLKISKLFYGTWPYKIECQVPDAYYVNKPRPKVQSVGPGLWAPAKKRQLTADEKLSHDNFKIALTKHSAVKKRTRVESRTYTIFCMTEQDVHTLYADIEPWVTHIYGPASEEDFKFMVENGRKKRLCDTLPKDKYLYRVYIDKSMPQGHRKNFVTWTEKYKDKILVSNSSKKWLSGIHQWIQGPFMYVEDAKTLAMVGLYLGNYVKLVEEFIVRDSINTQQDDKHASIELTI